ncbi:P2X purinoceptor 7-like [Haliotis rubra]|uniref:P2X purinoceptor 7-like n=1 Tax=Haliotis rubra TaxID=36100 RepID=UPI001EE583E7|nr:P2X purinoceptor 7-like [Haliotis rubra]
MSGSNSDSDSLSLSMDCQSTSSDCFSDTNEETIARPYLFEPDASDSENGDQSCSSRLQEEDRLVSTYWCSCDTCETQPTIEECCCCHEQAAVREKMEEHEDQISCITDHPGFEQVCLSVYALQTAYYHYRQEYGRGEIQDIHKKYRYTAYRQFVRWCWQFLGRKVRVVIPSCIVNKIRGRFPSPEYAGFKYPQLDK